MSFVRGFVPFELPQVPAYLEELGMRLEEAFKELEANSGLGDAPSDGKTYGRLDGAWAQVIDTRGGQTIQESLTTTHQLTIDARGNAGSATELNFFNDFSGAGGAWDLVTLDSSGDLQLRAFTDNTASAIAKTFKFKGNGDLEMAAGGAFTLFGANNRMKMSHAADRFYMAPYDENAWQWSREFGYDNALNAWYCETTFYPKNNIRIKGTSTGVANSSWLGFYESNGSVRDAYIGIGSTSNSNLYLRTEKAGSSTVIRSKGSDSVLRTAASFGGANGECHLYYKSSEKFRTDPNGIRILGHTYPNVNNTYDLGASTLQYRAVYALNYAVNAGSGYGIRFWRSDKYKIYMAQRTYTGLSNPTEVDTTPDYNMYFRMTNGAARGWVFYNDSASSTPALQITGAGNAYLRGNGKAVDWIATSDRRIKQNIEPIEDALSRLRHVVGCTFDKEGATQRMAGVIAQDVEEALPEAVVDGKVKGVSPSGMVGLLVEAVKELDAKVEALL